MAAKLHTQGNPGPRTTTTTLTPADNVVPPIPLKRQRRRSIRLSEMGDRSPTLFTKNLLSLHHPSSQPTRTCSITTLVEGHDLPKDSRTFSRSNKLKVSKERMKSNRAIATKRGRSNWSLKWGRSNEESKSDEGKKEGKNGDNLWRNQVENNAIEVGNENLGDAKRERVRSWLSELGLIQYAPVFERHEVDSDVLPMLTLEDLKDMGINAVGSRRKMYTAIEKLCNG